MNRSIGLQFNGTKFVPLLAYKEIILFQNTPTVYVAGTTQVNPAIVVENSIEASTIFGLINVSAVAGAGTLNITVLSKNPVNGLYATIGVPGTAITITNGVGQYNFTGTFSPYPDYKIGVVVTSTLSVTIDDFIIYTRSH